MYILLKGGDYSTYLPCYPGSCLSPVRSLQLLAKCNDTLLVPFRRTSSRLYRKPRRRRIDYQDSFGQGGSGMPAKQKKYVKRQGLLFCRPFIYLIANKKASLLVGSCCFVVGLCSSVWMMEKSRPIFFFDKDIYVLDSIISV